MLQLARLVAEAHVKLPAQPTLPELKKVAELKLLLVIGEEENLASYPTAQPTSPSSPGALKLMTIVVFPTAATVRLAGDGGVVSCAWTAVAQIRKRGKQDSNEAAFIESTFLWDFQNLL